MAWRLWRFGDGDLNGFKLLTGLACMYALMSLVAYSVLHMGFVRPLGPDAPLDRFSEARAVDHVRVLAHDIGNRQEGSVGIRKAAWYIKSQLELLRDRAGPELKIEIEESVVAGSFNMIFLGHSISFGYRNHTNIVARISSADSSDSEPSVLVNGHFDSPLGSPGAGDCGSCIASMLELARLTVDSGWTPPKPIIFLFNGAEELFMLGAHGFMKTNKWRDSIGAAINVEASGTGGPDLVCQSGPGSWPSTVYAKSAVYPMAHSAAQDVFPVIPGDTDYRMFSEDYGNIPGLDVIFLLGGYFYHTSYDTVDRLLPGSIQVRGDNLLSLVKGFTNSSLLKNSWQRKALETANNVSSSDRAVFFDYFSWFMVYYPRRVAIVLHSIPLAILIILPFLLPLLRANYGSPFAIFWDIMKGILLHAAGIILAVIFPVVFSILRLMFTKTAMNWFANPYLAFIMFIPSSVFGLLMPRLIWKSFRISQKISGPKMSKEVLMDEARFWGAFGFYAIITVAYLFAGLSGGFLYFLLSAFMLASRIIVWVSSKSGGFQSFRSTIIYVMPLVPCIAYSVYFSGFLIQFLIEKMGMMGSIAPPYGFFIPDIIVAALIGVGTGWCMGPLIPVCGRWLAKSSILQFLLHLTVVTLALSSQFFPYSKDAPKRVVLQNTYVTEGGNQLVQSSYDFAVVDSNDLPFLFRHSPVVADKLQITLDYSLDAGNLLSRQTWMGLFPVAFLFSKTLTFPAESEGILKQHQSFPVLSPYKPQTSGLNTRRVHLELSLGSLKEVWVAVLNVTGPLSGWSFADGTIPAPETADGGPLSYICRLSGYSDENWTFWLEANNSGKLRVDVAVIDQHLTDAAAKLKGLFPEWADVTAYSSFMSSYLF
ncbi:hypothetical protein MLD38_011871 [Melastoma candidum]|uniref:Uncharacterized protein n=1 Tax=Melastoma candidum TaxID=119954 RepID=A0ACB9R7G4_9MYRT|nr:hypothetical protein MLD38_011871 [Melastoma candidum]